MADNNIENYLQAIISNQATIHRQNQEIIFSQVFHDTIKGSTWLPADFAFSPGRGALGYPALYVLYRILNEVRPKRILETGMGQSTKMIGLYNHEMKDCKHYVVEHDAKWIDFFTNHFDLSKTTETICLPIIDAPLEMDDTVSNVTTYVGFSEAFQNQKFDFICIDGPYGFRSPNYSRIDILGILPKCLEDSFVIMLDDCDRTGELNTFNLITEALAEENIAFSHNIYNGEKGTGLIVSEDLSFLCTM